MQPEIPDIVNFQQEAGPMREVSNLGDWVRVGVTISMTTASGDLPAIGSGWMVRCGH